VEQRQNDLWLNVTLRWEGVEEKLCYPFEAEAESRLRALIATLEGSRSAAQLGSADDGKGSSDGRAKVNGTGDGAGLRRSDLGQPH
jgi:hypothetical protein